MTYSTLQLATGGAEDQGAGSSTGIDEVDAGLLADRYRLHTRAGWHMAIFASMVVVRTDRGDDMFCTMANRHGRRVLDLGAESLF